MLRSSLTKSIMTSREWTAQEFIELAGTAGTNLSGWTLQLMNGASDLPYPPLLTLPNFTFTNETGTGWGFFVAGRPSVANNDFDLGGDGTIQNGVSDGIQLIDPSSNVVQYVEYDGTALTEPDDIVPGAVVDSPAVTRSIYKTGTGSAFGDFTWDNVNDSLTPGSLESWRDDHSGADQPVIDPGLVFYSRTTSRFDKQGNTRPFGTALNYLAHSLPSLSRPAFSRSAGSITDLNSTSALNVRNHGSAKAGILDGSARSQMMTARVPCCSVK